MIKGFCVINNERIRILYGDCERAVILFAQQPFAEEGGIKLPATKRQRVEALTLDLDLSRVQECEAFDWTQASLGDGALLSLGSVELPIEAGTEKQLPTIEALPSLLEEAGLLDEAFPGLDAPVAAPVPSEEALAVRFEGNAGGAAGSLGVEVVGVPATPSEAGGAMSIADTAMAVGEQPDAFAIALAEDLIADAAIARLLPQPPEPRRRGPRPLARPPPGVVFGFDLEAMMPKDLASPLPNTAPMGPAECAAGMVEQGASHLGPLRALFDPPEAEFRAAAAAAAARAAASVAGVAVPSRHRFRPEFLVGPSPRHGELQEEALYAPSESGAASVVPDVQEFLGAANQDQLQPQMLGAIFAEPPQGAAFVEAAAHATDAAVEAAQGRNSYSAAGMEIAGVLQGGEAPLEDLAVDEMADAEAPYDLQTSQVGIIIRRFVQRREAEGGDQDVLLDDLLPPGTTDRATAARTFGSLLALATGGDLRVRQSAPFSPIAVSLP
eukprot:TRINITY_DN14006_c0_g1_i1.p1 TRINITY_DN14006_c0_g1~~TRINITY_DN14006_c0_g1_i1.p1  ORF type:complete len:579 (+),score=128.50 TRINITY_DN14006_c0_g1_i1:247-1737(+)